MTSINTSMIALVKALTSYVEVSSHLLRSHAQDPVFFFGAVCARKTVFCTHSNGFEHRISCKRARHSCLLSDCHPRFQRLSPHIQECHRTSHSRLDSHTSDCHPDLGLSSAGAARGQSRAALLRASLVPAKQSPIRGASGRLFRRSVRYRWTPLPACAMSFVALVSHAKADALMAHPWTQ
eukprot:990600-Rhodomonas_salina.1